MSGGRNSVKCNVWNMSYVGAKWKIKCYLNLRIFTDSRKHKNYVISYEPLKLGVNYTLYTFKERGLYSL